MAKSKKDEQEAPESYEEGIDRTLDEIAAEKAEGVDPTFGDDEEEVEETAPARLRGVVRKKAAEAYIPPSSSSIKPKTTVKLPSGIVAVNA